MIGPERRRFESRWPRLNMIQWLLMTARLVEILLPIGGVAFQLQPSSSVRLGRRPWRIRRGGDATTLRPFVVSG